MSDVGNLFEDVGQKYFNTELAPVTRVYVDLEYIQDLKLGALLSRLTVPQEMQYVHARFKSYNNRYDLLTAKYFPVLKITEAMLLQDLQDTNKLNKICLLAPWTSTYYHLIELVELFKQHNSKLTDDNIPMTLTINIADVQYPVILQKKLKQVLHKILQIDIEIISMPRYTDDPLNYLQYQLMFLYDYGQFVNQLAKPFVNDGKFIDTKIIAQPYIQSDLGHKPDDYEHVLNSTEKGLDIYCDFSFLRSNITLTK